MPNEKIRLSISNPVRMAKSNKDGGDQYSGTKSGSVNPRSDVHKLTTRISFRSEKIRLSISNPVRMAKSNKDGGDQYSGTKSGSVNPRSDVHKLTTSISFFSLSEPRDT